MIVITPFKATDFADIELKNDVGLQYWTHLSPEQVLAFMEKLPTRTVRAEGKVVAIYGLVPMWDKVSDLFFFPAVGWEKYKFSICKTLKRELLHIRKWHRRIQVTCLHEWPFCRFVDFLGFKEEGILRKFDIKGRDYCMLSIIGEG